MSEIHFKIHQGTGRLTGTSLCKSCQRAMIWTDHFGEHTQCSRMDTGIFPHGKVMECNEYFPESLTSLHNMEAVAWTLNTDENRKIGFKPPTKKGTNGRD